MFGHKQGTIISSYTDQTDYVHLPNTVMGNRDVARRSMDSSRPVKLCCGICTSMLAADPLGPVSCELEIPWILGLQLGNLGAESTSQTFLIPFYQHELFLQFEQQQLVCWWAGLRSPRASVSLGRP